VDPIAADHGNNQNKKEETMKQKNTLAAVAFALGAAFAVTAMSQEEVLPRPPQPFKGKIGRTAAESTPDFPKGIEAPKGAPNVLLF
jgi:arylsulfatase